MERNESKIASDEFKNGKAWVNNQELCLPTELLLHVGFYIDHKQILVQLCMASKSFLAIYSPFLYKSISTHTRGPRPNIKVLYLFTTLQAPRYSSLVTELRVALLRGTACLKWTESRLKAGIRECACDAYDAEIGRTIEALDNLRMLEVTCGLCGDVDVHQHSLVRLYAPKAFKIKCGLRDLHEMYY